MEQAEAVTKSVSRWAKLRRALRWLMIATAVAAVCGLAWTHYSYQRFCAAYPPPGELVNVDGIDFHVVVRGEPQPGEPTVVLEVGCGGGVVDALDYVEQCAPFCRILVLDRRGHGYSTGVPHSEVTPTQNVKDLRAVLQAMRIEPPYIFIGHSMGGLHARLWEATYPDEVAGLMLVDSVGPPTENQFKPLPWFLYPLAYSSYIGIPQLLGMETQDRPMWPKAQAAQLEGQRRSAKSFLALIHHAAGLINNAMQHASVLGAKCNVPVTVISTVGPPGSGEDWRQAQKELQAISDTAKCIDLDCDHAVFWVEPQLCVDELRDLLLRVRQARDGESPDED